MFTIDEVKPVVYIAPFIGTPVDCWNSWVTFINEDQHDLKISYTYRDTAYIISYVPIKRNNGEVIEYSKSYLRELRPTLSAKPKDVEIYSAYREDKLVSFYEPCSVSVNGEVLDSKNWTALLSYVVERCSDIGESGKALSITDPSQHVALLESNEAGTRVWTFDGWIRESGIQGYDKDEYDYDEEE